ncbi:MAG TPA: 50S ribosomal protein L10 [Acidimicrobiia bacterium]|nr:50S ribosomal protein L10 [Acidimicrobiia bacterium]
MAREPRAEKASVVKDVRKRFDEAEAVLVTEYRGLDVTQMTELRNALRDAEAIYKIYKNTLVRRALEEGFPESFVDMIIGPTALAFVDKDPGAAAKALKQFAAVNDALIIKGGLLNGEVLDEAQVRQLADLPSREELLTSLAAGLAAPLQQMASMMNNLLSEMANLLQSLSDKGEQAEAEVSAEEAVDADSVTAEDADDEEPSEQTEAEVSAEEAVDADSVTAEDADDEEPSEQAEAETPAEKTPTKPTQEDGSEAATEEN